MALSRLLVAAHIRSVGGLFSCFVYLAQLCSANLVSRIDDPPQPNSLRSVSVMFACDVVGNESLKSMRRPVG